MQPFQSQLQDTLPGQGSEPLEERVNLIPFVRPDTIGDGNWENVTVSKDSLILDANSSPSSQVWIDFHEVDGAKIEIGAEVSLHNTSDSAFCKLTLLNTDGSEYNTILIVEDEASKRSRMVLQYSGKDGSNRVLADHPLEDVDLATPRSLELALDNNRLTARLDRTIVLTTHIDNVGQRVAAISCFGCRCVFQRPYAIYDGHSPVE